MVTGLPLDDVRDLLKRLPQVDAQALDAARAKIEALSQSGLPTGRAGHLAAWFCGWSGRFPPRPTRGVVALFLGTHADGIQRLSGRAPGFEQRFVEHAAAGGAPVSQICGTHDLGLKVFDLALDLPVDDLTVQPALDERDCAATIAFGMEAVAGGADLLCLGAMSVGSKLSNAALMAAVAGGAPGDWLVDDGDGQAARQADAALQLHGAALRDPLEALRRLGGRETAAIVGAILAARAEKVPVVLDGATALAAATVLNAAQPGSVAHCVLADAGNDAQHRAAARMDMETVLGLGLGTGDGTAGAMAAGVLRDAALILDQTVPLPAH